MGTVLQGGTLVEFEPARVERADLRVEDGKVVGRGLPLTPSPGDEVLDLNGKFILPGLVLPHHHLYATLLTGMPGAFGPEEYPRALENGLWRLSAALDLDTVQLSAALGALEALQCGTTTVVDHHASPRAVLGSLKRVARGVNDVGLRGLLAYEVTDRHGPEVRAQALEETVGFLHKAQGRFRGMVGADAAAGLSDDALKALSEVAGSSGVGLHVHLAEDPTDERLSRERYGQAPTARLIERGLLSPKAVVAHGVHLSWPELSEVIATGAWLVHLPRSNMHHQVGYAPAGKFGARALAGTDGLGGDVWGELKAAHFRAREAGQPIDVLRWLANGHRLASDAFGLAIGRLEPGAAADLQVMDYRPPTRVDAATLASHVVHGFSARWVESVMVDGIWRLWARRPLSVDPDALTASAQEASAALFQRLPIAEEPRLA